MSKYGIISCSYFPVFGVNSGKHGPEITPYFDIFHYATRNRSNGTTESQKEKKPVLMIVFSTTVSEKSRD